MRVAAPPVVRRRLPAEQPGEEDAQPDGDADVDEAERAHEQAYRPRRVLVFLDVAVAVGVEDRGGAAVDHLDVDEEAERQEDDAHEEDLKRDQPRQEARAAVRRRAVEAAHHLRAPQQHELEQHVGRDAAAHGRRHQQHLGPRGRRAAAVDVGALVCPVALRAPLVVVSAAVLDEADHRYEVDDQLREEVPGERSQVAPVLLVVLLGVRAGVSTLLGLEQHPRGRREKREVVQEVQPHEVLVVLPLAVGRPARHAHRPVVILPQAGVRRDHPAAGGSREFASEDGPDERQAEAAEGERHTQLVRLERGQGGAEPRFQAHCYK